MAKDDKGVWSLAVSPLKSEFYNYTFVVNWIPALDGNVARIHRFGSRYENILITPGAPGDLYEVNNVPHGTLSQVWYKSPTLKLTRRIQVYTPAGYEDSKTPYPVLHLLHGAAVSKRPGPPMGGMARRDGSQWRAGRKHDKSRR